MVPKKIKGFMTVEASFLMPIILFLYLAILGAALLLYERCTLSQNCFLLVMRGANFTWASEKYGEVIYEDVKYTSKDKEYYIADRWQRQNRSYVGMQKQQMQCIANNVFVSITAKEQGVGQRITKKADILNPVKQVREGRKKKHA